MIQRGMVALALLIVPAVALATGPALAQPPARAKAPARDVAPAPDKAAAPAAAAAATGPLTYTPTAWPEPPPVGPLIARLALATAVVLGLGLGASWGVRRFGPRPTAATGDARLRLVETLALGNGSSLYLLECCGRRFVAGVSAGGLRSLAPLTESFENEMEVLAALT